MSRLPLHDEIIDYITRLRINHLQLNIPFPPRWSLQMLTDCNVAAGKLQEARATYGMLVDSDMLRYLTLLSHSTWNCRAGNVYKPARRCTTSLADRTDNMEYAGRHSRSPRTDFVGIPPWPF